MAGYPREMASHGPCRTMGQVLGDLRLRLSEMPSNSPGRAAMVARIRNLEDEITGVISTPKPTGEIIS